MYDFCRLSVSCQADTPENRTASRRERVPGTYSEELGLQQTLQHLVAAFPPSLLLQHALQEDPDLSDLSVCWQQIDGLGDDKNNSGLEGLQRLSS